MTPRRTPHLRPLRVVVAIAAASVLAIGLDVGVASAADPVGGPVGPVIACVNPLIPAGKPLRCQLTGYVPDQPIRISVSGHGDVTSVRPNRIGRAHVSLTWPYSDYGIHTVVAAQGEGSDARWSSTRATRGGLTLAALAAKSAGATGSDSGTTPKIAPMPRPTSQVPMRVSAALGLTLVGLGVLAVRHRRSRRLGL